MESTSASNRQASTDRDHLLLLAIFYGILGVVEILFSSLFIVHVAIGVRILMNPAAFVRHAAGPPMFIEPVMALVFVIVGSCAVLAGWTMGLLSIFTAYSIHRRKRRFFTLLVAGLSCVFYPFGTALGIWTFFVLGRESVRKLYESPSATVARA
jgi:hypothetical protein